MQYRVKSDFLPDTFTYNLALHRGKEVALDVIKAQRVFQVEDKLVLVGLESFWFVDQTSFRVEHEEKLCRPVADVALLTILNTTPLEQRFSKRNL